MDKSDFKIGDSKGACLLLGLNSTARAPDAIVPKVDWHLCGLAPLRPQGHPTPPYLHLDTEEGVFDAGRLADVQNGNIAILFRGNCTEPSVVRGAIDYRCDVKVWHNGWYRGK